MNGEKLTLPPHDFTLSPCTGWTYDHWTAVLEKMLLGAVRCFDGEHSWPEIPGPRDGDALAAQLVNPGGGSEKLNRTMMLAATWFSATGRTTVDGYDGDVAEIYRRGLVDSFSGGYHDRREKNGIYRRCCPAAHLAMLLAWDQLVEPLTAEQKGQLADYLRAYVHHHANESNLLLFSMTPAMLLNRLGADYDREVCETNFRRILNMYRGDGWFIDGWNQQFDNYNFWGFQLYLHLFMCFDPDWRERYGPVVKEITAAHEQTVPFWFGPDGAPIAKGRSLNYRFAAVSGLQWAQKSGLNAMAPGLARRICSGCIKFFAESHELLRDDLVLPIGYLGENSAVGEDYTDSGAPYWAATGLTALTLGREHPFWTAIEQPSPADDEKRTSYLPVVGARMTLRAGGPRHENRMLVAGEPFRHSRIWQAGSKYYQHAYSSTLGFALAGDLGPELSAGRTGLSRDGVEWAYRTQPRMVRLDARGARSEWNAWNARDGWTGLVITETFLLAGGGELHVFWHRGVEPVYLRLGGWAARVDYGEEPACVADAATLTVSSAFNFTTMRQVAGLAGKLDLIELPPRKGFSHSHLFGGWSCWPQWTSAEPAAPGDKIAIYVDAARRETQDAPNFPDTAQLLELTGKILEEE